MCADSKKSMCQYIFHEHGWYFDHTELDGREHLSTSSKRADWRRHLAKRGVRRGQLSLGHQRCVHGGNDPLRGRWEIFAHRFQLFQLWVDVPESLAPNWATTSNSCAFGQPGPAVAWGSHLWPQRSAGGAAVPPLSWRRISGPSRAATQSGGAGAMGVGTAAGTLGKSWGQDRLGFWELCIWNMEHGCGPRKVTRFGIFGVGKEMHDKVVCDV